MAITRKGDIIVTEIRNDCVTLYNKEGNKVKSFGSRGAEAGQFHLPHGVVVTAGSYVLVADSLNKRIQQLTMTGEHVKSVSSHYLFWSPKFGDPCGLAVHPSGKIFITDLDKCNVQVLNADLTFSHMFGNRGSAQGQFKEPWDVAVDSQGMVYVADNLNYRVQKFTPDGKYVMAIGRRGSQPGELNQPISLAIDRTGNMYVGESGNKRVSVFTCNGEFLYCFGEGQFNPWGLAIDEGGHLYVCDCVNDRIVIY